MSLMIVHDLSKLSQEQLTQYLRDVSEHIGLDPNMGSLDTIWMQNENGVGQSLVVYARRGTAEILRDVHDVSVESLTETVVNGSIVFTATGTNKKGRREIAKGAKFIDGQHGKQLDNSIMSASTRALRRLTMQFTGLGILDESEVLAVEPSTANPATDVKLAPAAPLATVTPNPAPAKVVELPPAFVAPVAPAGTFATNQAEHIAAAQAQAVAKTAEKAAQEPAKSAAISVLAASVTPAVAPVTPVFEPDISADKTSAPKSARKPRKAKNAVSLGDVEPETVNAEATAPAPAVSVQAPVVAAVPIPDAPPVPVAALAPPPQAPPVPTVAPPAAVPAGDYPGKPSDEQMKSYRSRVSTFTAQIPASEGQGSVQKMRAFITQMTGKPPAAMTVEEWEDQLSWFDTYVAQHSVKDLVEYINAFVGAK